MNTTVLKLPRPWPQRLIDRLRTIRFDRAAWKGDPGWREADAQTLRDLGVDVSEFGSIAAEANGTASRTRRRITAGGRHG